MTASSPTRAVVAGRTRVIGVVPLWRRIVGLLLVLYGIAGLALVGGGAVLVAGSVARLDGLASTIDEQRAILVRSLDATATFLTDAQSGTGNVQVSLTSTVDSARKVAGLTRSLSTAMGQLGQASTISIFGTAPFGGLTGTFGDVATQADALGTSLDATADDLATNGTDLARVHDDIGSIRTEIDSLRTELSGAGLGGADLDAVSHALETSRLVLLGLLGWLAVQAVIAIVAGLVIATRRAAVAVPIAAIGQTTRPVDDLV
jgi:hypothetical protein